MGTLIALAFGIRSRSTALVRVASGADRREFRAHGYIRVLVALLLVAAGGVICLLLFSGRTVDYASIPGHEVDGTIEVTIASDQRLHLGSSNVICERSPFDGLVRNVRSPNIGTLNGARIWMVLQLESPGVVLALGHAALGNPPYYPTGEYGGGVAQDSVHQAGDRSQGSLSFNLPLVKGEPFAIQGATTDVSGTLAWECEGPS